MTAEYYRNVLLKHWRLIILCTLLMTAGAAIGSLFAPPLYQSRATIQLGIPPSGALSPDMVSGTLQSEANLANGDSMLAQVVVHYPGLTIEKLRGELALQVVQSTRLLLITILDRNSARAAHLANDLAAALIAQQVQATQQFNAQSQQGLLDSIAATQKQIDADTATLNSLQASNPANQQQIQQLQSDLASLQQQHDQELQTLIDLQNEEARTSSFLQLAEAAQPSSTPLHAFQWLVLGTAAGLGLGLLLGITLVLLRDRLDQPILAVSALSTLSGWPVLEELGAPAADSLYPEGSAGQQGTQHPEPYHGLGRNLAFLGMEAPLFSIVVTSTLPDTKVANVVAGDLALLLTRVGKRVVLVDANFSRSMQHRRFGTPLEPGLGAAVLAFIERQGTQKSLEPYLYPASDGPSLLRVLPAGPVPPNPKQVLKSRAMREAFQTLSDIEADIVVLAGPPVAGSAEACALAALADGVIVVLKAARPRRQKLMQMKRLLEEAGANVLGLVAYSGPLSQSARTEQPDRSARIERSDRVEGAPIS